MNEVANGLAGIDDPPAVALIPRGTGGDFVRTFGIPSDVATAARMALRRRRAADRPRAGSRFRSLGRAARRSALFANVASAGMSGAIAQRANDTSKALGAKASYLWATFAVFAAGPPWRRSLTVDDETAQRQDVRRRRRERPLLRRRDEDVPGCAARRRPPRRRHDRRRDEARSRPDDAEDLPRHPSPAPEGRGAPWARRDGRDRRAGPGRARRRAARHDTGAVRGPPRRVAAAGASGVRAEAGRRQDLVAAGSLRPGRLGRLRFSSALATSSSSFATRSSSSSIPRTFLPSSSTRVRRSLTAFRAFDAAREARRAARSSARRARRAARSRRGRPLGRVCVASGMPQSYHRVEVSDMDQSYHLARAPYCCDVPEGFRSAYDVRVRFAETDAQGIAHHAVLRRLARGRARRLPRRPRGRLPRRSRRRGSRR